MKNVILNGTNGIARWISSIKVEEVLNLAKYSMKGIL